MIKYIFVAVVIFCALQSTIAQTAVMLPSVNPGLIENLKWPIWFDLKNIVST